MKTTAKPKAAFGTDKRNVPGVIARAKAMYAAIFAAIATYNALPVAIAAFLAMLDALVAAQTAATGTKAKGLAAVRDSKRDTLWAAMVSIRAYVQQLADAAAHADAIGLIEQAGLLVAGVPHHTKPILDAKLTTVPGFVQLIANAHALLGGQGITKKTTFQWQISSDGGKTWTSLPPTPYASTEVTGLTLLTEYRFRVCAIIAKTPGEWSQEVKVLVH
jgi:hypothetical protein